MDLESEINFKQFIDTILCYSSVNIMIMYDSQLAKVTHCEHTLVCLFSILMNRS